MLSQRQKNKYGRVNHVKLETAEEAPDVVVGTFLVNTYPATILFDTRASHTFLSAQFVEKHNIATCTMQNTTIVKSPRGKMHSNTVCLGVSIKLRGVDFPVNPIMLGSEGLDMILGMRWLAKFKGTIQCVEKSITLIAPSGDRIEVKVSMSPSREGTTYHMSSGSVEDIRVVKEFPDVFREDLLGMPPEHEIEFVIDLLPGTAPISKRPYRMVVNKLEELNKQLR